MNDTEQPDDPYALLRSGPSAEEVDAAACEVVGCERPPKYRGYCNMHYQRLLRHGDPGEASPRKGGDPVARFWRYVDKSGTGGCWLWTNSLTEDGYGRFWPDRTRVLAHRFAYELIVGPIPEGLQLDHLCRVRRCVNPAHLEPVTAAENARRSPVTLSTINSRKTHCVNGHELTAGNTAVDKRGWRACRACVRIRKKAYRSARRVTT
jgi:hypothetical protein